MSQHCNYREPTMNQHYQQPERFALMLYKCQSCNLVEPVWNSRNAVTPFCIPCGDEGCEGPMQHIEWQRDTPFMTLPDPARRVFVSITRADAWRLAEEKWDHLEAKEDPYLPPEPKKEVVPKWADHIYGDGNQPYVVTRSEYLKRKSQ